MALEAETAKLREAERALEELRSQHYEETDHPVVHALRPASTWRWCYVHRRAV